MELQQTSNQYGISQELLFLSELVNYGVVSIPYGNSGRYDCILDIEGDIYKIQIKSVNLTDENTITIPFANSRMTAQGVVRKEYTPNEVDFIGIIYKYKIYLFPASMAHRALTVKITSNNLKSNSHFLEDFSIEKVLGIDLKTWVSLKEETKRTKGQNYNKPEFFCSNCGAPVSRQGNLCITCAGLELRKVKRPSRDVLKELIRTTSFTEIGHQYQVTDNCIRKWCKAENLPFRVRDIKKYSDNEWEEI